MDYFWSIANTFLYLIKKGMMQMATILNPGIVNDRIYHKNTEGFDVTRDLMSDTGGGMSSEFEDNLRNLNIAAKQKMTKLKPRPDFKTENKSFLALYNDLYRLGITNNKFFLRLYDQDLVGVNVYKQVLPLEFQMKVLLEILINPWYYLREICRIPVDGLPIEPGGGSEFLADRNNIASWYCFLNGMDHYDSKSRQLGKTQNAIAEFTYAFLFGAMSSTFLFFNKDFQGAKDNLYRLKCQRDMLPAWLQMRLAYSEDGTVDKGNDSATVLRNPINGNIIHVMPRATSHDSAIQLGRGKTAAFHYQDEFDFEPYNTEIKDAASYSYATASANAKKNYSLYGRILTSTPGYLSTKQGKDAAKMIDRMLKWDDHLYDMPINQLKKNLNSKKYNKFVYVEHSWQQLKKSRQWYEEQCGLVDYDTDKILREIGLQRIQGNELSPFKKASLVHISRNQKSPIDKDDINKDLNPVYFFEKINPKIRYILSIDPAEGLGLNNNAFVLINPHTLMPVAEYKSPYISPPDYFRMICKFLEKYCKYAMIVIESNRGRELINRFLESKFRYQLWYDSEKLTAKAIQKTDKYGEQVKSANERRMLGFDTTRSSKPLLFSIIEQLMEEDLGKICTPYLVKDVTSMIRKPNGTIKLGVGDDDDGVGHGDNLMAYLIGLYVYYNAKNLEEFGIIRGAKEPIDPNRPLTDDEKRANIVSAMDSLPEDLREMFQRVLQESDPVKSAKKYETEVQRQLSMENPQTDQMSQQHFVDTFMDDKMWAQRQQQIIDQSLQGPSQTFNINDWL